MLVLCHRLTACPHLRVTPEKKLGKPEPRRKEEGA
jgi:hypothetical protein